MRRTYFVEGGHGSLLLLGWWNWEGGWERGGRKGIEHFLALARRGQGCGLELDGFTLEHMRATGQADLLRRLAEAGRTGSLEQIGGTYSQAYLASLWEESNLRQFLIGLDSFQQSEIPVTTFGYQEPAFHPQLPQILRFFGYERAVLRTHWPFAGRERTLGSPVIRWRGLDGSTIPAITDPPAISPPGKVLVSKLGDLMVFGRVPIASRLFQRPRFMPAVLFRRTTFSRYLDRKRDEAVGSAPEERYLDATDSTLRLPWGAQAGVVWSELRAAEARLLEAEKIASLSSVLGGGRFERALETAWKALLASESHDFFMCPSLFCPTTGERTYRTARRLIGISKRISNTVARLGAETVAAALSPAVGDRAREAKHASMTLVGVNPLNWQREGWVEGDLSFPRGRIFKPQIWDAEQALPTVLEEEKRWADGSLARARVRFPARLPSIGARVFQIAETTVPQPAEPEQPPRNVTVSVRLAEGRLILEGHGREVPLAIKLGRRPVPIEGLESLGTRGGLVRMQAFARHKSFNASLEIGIEGSRVSFSLNLGFPHRARVGPQLRAFHDLGKLRLAIPWRGEARRNLPFAFYAAPRRGGFLANDMVYGEDCAVLTAGSPGFHLASGVLSYPLATSTFFLYGILALSGTYLVRLAIDIDPPEEDGEAMRRVMEWRHPLLAIHPRESASPRSRDTRGDPARRSISLLPECRDLAVTALFPRHGSLQLHAFALGSREVRWTIPGQGLLRSKERIVHLPPHGIRRVILHPVRKPRDFIDFTTHVDLDSVAGPFSLPLPPYLPWRPIVWKNGTAEAANDVAPLTGWTYRGRFKVTSECAHPPRIASEAPTELFLEYDGWPVTTIFDDIPTPSVARAEERIEARAQRMRVKRGWLVSGRKLDL